MTSAFYFYSGAKSKSDVVVAETAEDGTLGDDQESDQDQTDEQTVENDQGPATKSEKEDGEVE